MSHFPDERTLQRCVDGELSESEQQSLLRQLDQHPAAWRDVALAFLEHQLWSRAGQAYVHESAAPIAVRESAPEIASAKHNWGRNSALVASTLLAIGLGFLGGQRGFPSKGDRSIAQQATIRNGGEMAKANAVLASTKPVAPSPKSSSPAAVSTTVAWPDNGRWSPPRLSEEDRQRLEDEGYQVIEAPQYYTVPIENNRHLVVPVNTIRLHQPLQ